mmetsp:Transcript_22015/g.60957  ORF Transcript_22015/g.60957 Transcript_22015/m.60957 type:complete len:223 (-) Transcript_22015:371-1039(-)
MQQHPWATAFKGRGERVVSVGARDGTTGGRSSIGGRACFYLMGEVGLFDRGGQAYSCSTLMLNLTAFSCLPSFWTVMKLGKARTSRVFSSRYRRALPMVSTALETASTPMDTRDTRLPSRTRAASAPATTAALLCAEMGSSTYSASPSAAGASMGSLAVRGCLATYSATLARRSLSRNAGWKLRFRPSRVRYWRAMQMLFTAWLMEAAPMQRVAGGSLSRAL